MQEAHESEARITEKLQPIDITAISLEDVDKLSNSVLRNAVESVKRNNSLPNAHKDHGSHSNNPGE